MMRFLLGLEKQANVALQDLSFSCCSAFAYGSIRQTSVYALLKGCKVASPA